MPGLAYPGLAWPGLAWRILARTPTGDRSNPGHHPLLPRWNAAPDQ